MYLVIKNGDTRKSYQCTNTCNKPRVRISNSYIPLTNNVQSKPKCKINSMEVASYRSYTYTAEQGTITTGTTYLTRTETTGTTYQTRASTYDTIYAVDKKTSVFGSTVNIRGTCSWDAPHQPTEYNESFILFNYISTYDVNILITGCLSFHARYSSEVSGNNFYGSLTTKAMYDGHAYYTQYYFTGGAYENLTAHRIVTTRDSYKWTTGSVTRSEWKILTTSSGIINKTTGTSYQTRASTYNTLYGTRASTSGTSYGTKTTNKTLTSSSWG